MTENAVEKSYTWRMSAYQKQGHLWINWDSDAPVRPQQGKICVYNSQYPSDPDSDAKAWVWDDSQFAQGWDTGLTWGSDWHCAWIAQQSKLGRYYYAYLTMLVTVDENIE